MKYLNLLKDPKNILALVAFIAALFRDELGLDTYVSENIATLATGAVLLYLGYNLRDTKYVERAEEILRPRTYSVLADLEEFIEDKYHITIPDDIKGEIVGLVYGEDNDAG